MFARGRLARRAGILVATAFVWLAAPGQASDDPEAFAELLRHRVELADLPGVLTVGSNRLHTGRTLAAFYERRAYQPAWIREGRPIRAASDLIQAIREVKAEGLESRHYHLAAIEPLLRALEDPDVYGERRDRALVDLELILSDAFFLIGAHFQSGRVDPERIDPNWDAGRRSGNLRAALERGLAEGKIREALRSLLPVEEEYWMLRSALARLREVAAGGGWPGVPPGGKLERGAEGERVTALRRRLAMEGDLAPELSEGETFDEDVESATRRFQQRNGLVVDGVVGPQTQAALDVTVAERVRQVEVNLERRRWLPRRLGERHVLVNIAAFRLDLIDRGERVLTMRAIVGRPYRRTPVLSSEMNVLVWNPSWYVPPNLARRDLAPRAAKDPEFLRQERFRVFDGWDAGARELDVRAVDWLRVASGKLNVRLRQDPGPMNALGRVKFLFPNRHLVYLHDTPSRGLFAQERRAFSSGCIRLERPIELATVLLEGDPRWTPEAIASVLESGRERTVPLPTPVPVHLLYWTAWADRNGTVHFRNDVYDRDAPVDRALRAEPPSGPPP